MTTNVEHKKKEFQNLKELGKKLGLCLNQQSGTSKTLLTLAPWAVRQQIGGVNTWYRAAQGQVTNSFVVRVVFDAALFTNHTWLM